jgi:hypothetical protein
MASPSLYRRVLGASFDQLPAVLQHFHDDPEGGRARGTVRVERGRGLFRNVAASVLGMPRAGEDVPVSLSVAVRGDCEEWVRHFGKQRVRSIQWASGTLLFERRGPVSFSSALVVRGSRLIYEFREAWFAGVPLSASFSPYVDGYVDAGEKGWRLVVHIFAPFLGEIVRYEGWVEPE